MNENDAMFGFALSHELKISAEKLRQFAVPIIVPEHFWESWPNNPTLSSVPGFDRILARTPSSS